jgi:predicted DNA-binding transcriptional regulator YafY
MMITINAKQKFTVGELAKEFHVSKRTILRDLQELEEAGFPLYSEVGAAGGYRILKERLLPPISFSESEAKAIFFAYQSLQYYRDLPFQEESVSALKKFFNYLPMDMQRGILEIQNKIVFWIPERHRNSPLLKEIFEIVIESKVVTIDYISLNHQYTHKILPLGLYAMNGLWYCPAYCFSTKKVKEFRVDRINKIVAVEQNSVKIRELPPDIQTYLYELGTKEECHIKITLTSIGVKMCESEFLLARGLQVHTDGTGIIDMKIPKDTLDWTADYFLSVGKEATIIAPAELVDKIKKKIEGLYNHYFNYSVS